MSELTETEWASTLGIPPFDYQSLDPSINLLNFEDGMHEDDLIMKSMSTMEWSQPSAQLVPSVVRHSPEAHTFLPPSSEFAEFSLRTIKPLPRRETWTSRENLLTPVASAACDHTESSISQINPSNRGSFALPCSPNRSSSLTQTSNNHKSTQNSLQSNILAVGATASKSTVEFGDEFLELMEQAQRDEEIDDDGDFEEEEDEDVVDFLRWTTSEESPDDRSLDILKQYGLDFGDEDEDTSEELEEATVEEFEKDLDQLIEDGDLDEEDEEALEELGKQLEQDMMEIDDLESEDSDEDEKVDSMQAPAPCGVKCQWMYHVGEQAAPLACKFPMKSLYDSSSHARRHANNNVEVHHNQDGQPLAPAFVRCRWAGCGLAINVESYGIHYDSTHLVPLVFG